MYPRCGSPDLESSGIRSSLSGRLRPPKSISARLLSMYLIRTLRRLGFTRSRPFLSVYDHRPSENPPANRSRAGGKLNAIRPRAGCGKQICRGKRYCLECAARATHENFDAGRKSAQQPESLSKRSATQRLHRQAIHNWKASNLPAWLTPAVFVNRLQPALASIPKARIRSALGVSEPYASAICTGLCRPHKRHWQALAELAGVVPGVPSG